MNWTVTLFICGCILPLGLPLFFLVYRWYLERGPEQTRNREQLLARRLAYRAATRGLRFKLLILLCVMFAVSGYQRIDGIREIGLGLLIGYCILLPIWALWPLWSRQERKTLEDQGYLICPKCEYDLRGTGPNGVCPECGFEYTQDLLRGVWTRAVSRGLRR